MKQLHRIHLAGLLGLAILCISQWNETRRLHQELNRVDRLFASQQEQQNKMQKENEAQKEDLQSFRLQVSELTQALGKSDSELRLRSQELENLTARKVQLEDSLAQWKQALQERDERIQDNQNQLLALAERLKETILEYNSLATNYNESVKILNDRTQEFNELVERYNLLSSGS